MNTSLISYTFKAADRDAWHREVAQFIGHLDSDPDLKGRIAYRCMKEKNGDRYFHVATPLDADAGKVLQGKDFFRAYQQATRNAGGGAVDVAGLETIAETAARA
jgi:hypothetical protein